MAVFLLQRAAILIATLIFASFVVFGVLEILPGNAAQTMLGTSATPESVAALSHKLGLDKPFAVRYLDWIAGALTRRSRPVLRLQFADRAADRASGCW